MVKENDILWALMVSVMVGGLIGMVSAIVFVAITQITKWAFITFAFVSVCSIVVLYILFSIALADWWKVLSAIAIVTIGVYLLVYERVVWPLIVNFVVWMQMDILVHLGVIIIILGMSIAFIVFVEEYMSNREIQKELG